MARIIKGPIEKEVSCNECSSVIGYLPEDVQEHYGSENGYKRVKCPRDKCPGHGYIKKW